MYIRDGVSFVGHVLFDLNLATLQFYSYCTEMFPVISIHIKNVAGAKNSVNK